MRIQVNDCRLYVDVVGSGLTAEGPKMVERPVVFVLHGGPGADHSTMKPDFNPLAEVAQLVYYDHRGQGRSDSDKSDNWHLDQWADDLRGLVDTLGIENTHCVGTFFWRVCGPELRCSTPRPAAQINISQYRRTYGSTTRL